MWRDVLAMHITAIDNDLRHMERMYITMNEFPRMSRVFDFNIKYF